MSSSPTFDVGPWGPAPDGVDLQENQDVAIIGSVVGVMTLGLLSVALRIFTRVMRRGSEKGPGLAADDYMILFAAVMGIGTAVCCLLSIGWGGGRHLWVVDLEQFTKLWQTTFGFVIVYITCVSATKLSIMLFYYRIFGGGKVWMVVLTFTCLHWAEVTITWLAGCRPIAYYWLQYTDPGSQGECIDAPKFYFANGIIGLVIDVAILVVPLPAIWALHLRTAKKIVIGGILALGGFVCVASGIRIYEMDQLVKSEDFTWAMSQVFIWSCCEPFVGIICACLPTYAPLVRTLWRRAGSSAYSGMPNTNTNNPSDRSRGTNPLSKRGGELTSNTMINASGGGNNSSNTNRKSRKFKDSALRGDDEVELTVDISGQKEATSSHSSFRMATQDEESVAPAQNEIFVRRDFMWSSTSR